MAKIYIDKDTIIESDTGVIKSNNIQSNQFIIQSNTNTIKDSGFDSIDIDTANTRYNFQINGETKGYIDSTGFHNGS